MEPVEETITVPLSRPTRRQMFVGSLAAALAVGVQLRQAAPVRAQSADDTSRRLIERTTMGWTQAEQVLVDSLGFAGYLEYQLAYEAIDDSDLNSRLAAYATLTMTPAQLIALNDVSRVRRELSEAVILRAIYSKRQLFERIVELWTDHFNINSNDGDVDVLKTIDDRDVVRARALDTFPNLLRASAHSPAMLKYLNNNTSTATSPNQNYARELMELHTLGVDGGYTQNDVREVARCLSGWTVNGSSAGDLNGTFRFDPSRHDNGSKVVLGTTIPAGGGITDGDTVLNLLANHPSTARFVGRKLASWLWGENPPDSLVGSAATTYQQTGGDIKAMIRVCLNYDVLSSAPLKLKRPFHLFVSALRTLQPAITSLSTFRTTHLASAGHLPYSWAPPDGYPDSFDYWSGLLLPRWNFGFSLMSNQISGMQPNMPTLVGSATTNKQIAYRISDLVFGGVLTSNETYSLYQYMGVTSAPTDANTRDAFALALALPRFQRY